MASMKAKKYEKHGMRNTPLYSLWKNMRQRCNNPNHAKYNAYGGKGIKVCPSWDKSFLEFYKWAMSNKYEQGLSIDRVDVNGDYTPANCRWISVRENSRHKTTTKMDWAKVKEARRMKRVMPELYDQTIADFFGVSQQNMNKILNNKLWVETAEPRKGELTHGIN